MTQFKAPIGTKITFTKYVFFESRSALHLELFELSLIPALWRHTGRATTAVSRTPPWLL